jgi:hypothetical protein
MNEQVAGARSAAGATELLSAARFQEELRSVARYRSSLPIGDPLEAAIKKITDNPAFTQSRLLARVLVSLAYEEGEFRRAELATFDSDTLAMVIILMDARADGTVPRDDWVRAADAVKAALLVA